MFEKYYRNLRIILKISRIIAKNFENYFIKFQISGSTSDIFDMYFSENFEKYFEKFRKLFRKFSISTPGKLSFFGRGHKFKDIFEKFPKKF